MWGADRWGRCSHIQWHRPDASACAVPIRQWCGASPPAPPLQAGERPWRYSSSVCSPQGSTKSDAGAYPESGQAWSRYWGSSGDRRLEWYRQTEGFLSKLARITSWVFSVGVGEVAYSPVVNFSSGGEGKGFRHVISRLKPIFEKSTLRRLMRGDVPVLNRRMGRPMALRQSDSPMEGCIPSGPEDMTQLPVMVLSK